MLLAAAVQLSCTFDEDANLASAETLIRRAADHGAQLIATPENTNFLGPHIDKVDRAESLDGRVGSLFSSLAAELGVHLLLGSFNEECEEPGRCYNTSVLYGPDGARLATYRKIHLFDIDLAGGVQFQESATVKAGDEVVVVSTALGSIGLSICYDLRFAELYRQLVDKGAEIVMIPSAFTMATGRAHWEPLMRARAIENQCFVVAPAQVGAHGDEGLRESFGNSMIVDPWGQILARASDTPGLALTEIDLEHVTAVRRSMPVSDHRRLV